MASAVPVSIGGVVRDAVLFGAGGGWSGDMADEAEGLVATVRHLFELLDARQLDYVLVGGIALLQYVDGRNTRDIDLILAEADLERLPELDLDESGPDFGRGHVGALQVDLLWTRNPLFDRIRRVHVERRRFAEQDIPCATVQGLMLLKLFALPSLYRQADFARVGLYENDVATLIEAYRPDTPALLNELAPYLSATDRTALADIVAEIEERVRRYRERAADADSG